MNGVGSLTGISAVVTGGASGLGRAMGEALAVAGAGVALLDRDGGTLDETVAAMTSRGLHVVGERCDVAEADSVDSAMKGAADRLGGIQAVFANAGMSAGPGPGSGGRSVTDYDDDVWDRVLAVNLTGVMRTARAAVPYLAESGAGRLVLTSSSASVMPTLFVGHAYAATKAAVLHMSRYLALELADRGILVNCIAPGPFLTNIAERRLQQPSVAEAVAQTVPLGRIANPAEIGPLAVFLAGPDSGYMTGAVLSIDGGTGAGAWHP